MLLLVGLGNPGSKYAGNRHNIGFLAVDSIVRRHGFGAWRKRFQGETSEGTLAGERILALKPLTYMNESGRAVGEAMRFYNLTPDDVVVLHDEIDLPPAKVRVKTGGGSAGNNGIRSIDAHIGNGYHRVRLGVGKLDVKGMAHIHVLGDFSKADKLWLEPLIDTLADNADLLAKRDFATFQNRVHLTLNPEPEKPKPGKKETD
ncbi:aminoacyl-tRNA hydrolase [Nordella sp. HKS 07]|uniref:aminoacyl-tRNA hydrolase n=1 Tax=Nordella sp. HKS 07 TaxID=2712222 RepID=UPI0013E1FFDF|nr:aminoacyl-tRNA hydrolase [Nordella sp. HKS 07]QIG46482.1 aminoacyl-tRNA hydrolase [Nordella sp. HKS 07]